MGLLCRAHIDKTFIDGAEKTSAWQDQVSAAIAKGHVAPPAPVHTLYQMVCTGSAEVTVYLPQEFVAQAFLLGGRYLSSSVRLCASSQLAVVQGSSCFSRPAGFT